MKQASLFFLLSFAILFANRSFAQNSRSLSIDQFNVPVDNLMLLDSVAGGRMIYTAVMDIAMRDNESGSVIKTFYAGLLNNKQLNLSIKTTDASGKVFEERVYVNAIVQEILLPVMDAADKNMMKIQVKIRANSLSLKNDGLSSVKMASPGRAAVMTANYRLTLGGLPAKRIAKIGSIRIVNNQLSTFSLEVSETDAGPWQNWLLSQASKKEQGMIEWLAPNMQDVIFRIDLYEVDIISAGGNYVNNSQAIQRVNFGLRGKVGIGKY